MRSYRVLRRVMKQTRAARIWYVFLILFFICAIPIWLIEPEIKTYGESLWYCFAVVTTIGFGDLTVHSIVSKIISVFLALYACMVIAIVTGVIVNYYNQLVSIRQKESLTALIEKLKILPELSKEELAEISDQIKKLN